jgi:ankyrin repeat protein
LAVYFEVEAVVQLLLTIDKVDADSKDSYGRTPLSWAASHGHDATVQLLLDTGKVDPDSRCYQTLLVRDENEPAVVYVDDIAKDSVTPLLMAALSGHGNVVKLLLATNSVDLNFKDGNGDTPLSWAAENGQEAVVKLLLVKDNIDLEAEDSVGWTPLSLAAANGNTAIVKLLLEKGAKLECKTKNGRTPLSWAASYRHEATVKLLLENGADIAAADPDRWKLEGLTSQPPTPITG